MLFKRIKQIYKQNYVVFSINPDHTDKEHESLFQF